MSVSEIFEIPKYYYFESGNDFSGSKDDFSYKIHNGDTLHLLLGEQVVNGIRGVDVQAADGISGHQHRGLLGDLAAH